MYVHIKLTPNIGLKPTAPEHEFMEVWADSEVSKFVPKAAGWTGRN